MQALERRSLFSRRRSRDQLLVALLKKNHRLLAEPVYRDALDGKAKQILKDYSLGRLIVAGDNRYLSGDLLDFMARLLPPTPPQDRRQRTFYVSAITNVLPEGSFYAPGAAYDHGDSCTLLRNPHIARNEELQLSLFAPKKERKQMRRHYLSHLTDVVMVDFSALTAERLGGADYDGDMIKTVADPILNACVRRNYDLCRFEKHKSLTNQENIPLLMIPAVEPLIRDTNDWEARFETVRSTFSSRVGQICNAALDRSIVAYNENSDAQERRRYQEETELLAILTGLEIDSAKSGVRPDLDEYLKQRKVQRMPFLQYKNLMEQAETRRAWYEPTHRQRLNAFFEKTDWVRVDANVERLPYLARQLERHTPAAKAKPAADSELFTFAQRPDWKEQLDRDTLGQIDGLFRDYTACLTLIRACRALIRAKRRKNDIERILFSMGQEDAWDTDELYAQLEPLPPERAAESLEALRQEGWQFLAPEDREQFLLTWLPELETLFDLLSDFRYGGYRVLGGLLCDVHEENTAQERKRLVRPGDSPAFAVMMEACQREPRRYQEVAASRCRALLEEIVKPMIAVRYVAALGRRGLLWKLLLDALEPNVLEVPYAE